MGRKPLTRDELDEMIAEGLAAVDDAERAAWARLRIEPEKWRCRPWSDASDGFWVVAERNGRVVWYNELEHGFNESAYSERGTIAEYGCNLHELDQYLRSVTEVLTDDASSPAAAGHALPPELDGGGTIVRRQTTSWDLCSLRGGPYRVHFKDKVELRFAGASYASIALLDEHPLLARYHEPMQAVYVSRPAADPEALLARLDEQVRATSAGWRSLAHYRYPMDVTLGHGLFLGAPVSIVGRLTELVADAGMMPYTVAGGQVPSVSPPAKRYRALVIDRSFIIARAFEIARLP